MLEFKIIQIGLILHLVIQVYNGFKLKNMRPNPKILWASIFIFFVVGSILTFMNLYSSEDFRECNTKRFNDLVRSIL